MQYEYGDKLTPVEWLEEEFDTLWKYNGYSWEVYSYELEQYVTRYCVLEWYIRSPGALMTIKEDQ